MEKLQTILTAVLVVVGIGILWQLSTLIEENRVARKSYAAEIAANKAEVTATEAKEKDEAKKAAESLDLHNAGRRGHFEAMFQIANTSGDKHAKEVANIELALLGGEITKDEALRELIALH